MQIKVPYGEGGKAIRLPPGVRIEHVAQRQTVPLDDLETTFANECTNPLAATPLGEMVTAESRIVILISDLTRSKGAVTLLPLCVQYLRDAGAARSGILILVARGTHRKLTKAERQLFKTEALAGIQVKEHDCDNTDDLSALLLTRRGTPVRINRAVKEADVTILLSPVSFHYFAGFGGARKLILPGCSDRNAIVANHRLSLVDEKPVTLHPRCRAGNLERNPVHEDMCEALDALDGIFSINFFCNEQGEVVFLNAGDPMAAHAVACESYRESHVAPIANPFDVLILSAGGFPYDINFLQSHKTLRHSEGALKRHGCVLFFAECVEGIGSSCFESALDLSADTLASSAYKEYDLNNQSAVSLRDLTDQFEIAMVSAMNVDVLLACGIKPCVNPEVFLAESLEKYGTDRIGVMLNGHSVLPQKATEALL